MLGCGGWTFPARRRRLEVGGHQLNRALSNSSAVPEEVASLVTGIFP